MLRKKVALAHLLCVTFDFFVNAANAARLLQFLFVLKRNPFSDEDALGLPYKYKLCSKRVLVVTELLTLLMQESCLLEAGARCNRTRCKGDPVCFWIWEKLREHNLHRYIQIPQSGHFQIVW